MATELSLPLNCQSKSLSPFGVKLEVEAASNVSISDLPIDDLKSLLSKHRFVLFRGFSRVPEKQEFSRLCNNWGELLEWEFGTVLEVAEHASPSNYIFTNGSVPYHWDGAFATRAPWLQWFQCLEAPGESQGGETLFCDTTRLWNSLSPQTQELWRSVIVDYSTEKKAHYGGSIESPLVSRHPLTGETVIRFAEPANATTANLNTPELTIRGIEEEERAGFLSDLLQKIYDARFVYAHVWQQSDFLVADNHALLHARTKYQQSQARRLWRVHVL